MIFFLRLRLRNENRRRKSLVAVTHDVALLKTFNGAILVLVLDLMYSGPGRRDIRARSSTLVVCVALKSMVWRSSLGRILTICLISSSNPTSSIRSASSMIRAFQILEDKALVALQVVKQASRSCNQQIDSLRKLFLLCPLVLLLNNDTIGLRMVGHKLASNSKYL